jgi:hypothetical protein
MQHLTKWNLQARAFPLATDGSGGPLSQSLPSGAKAAGLPVRFRGGQALSG